MKKSKYADRKTLNMKISPQLHDELVKRADRENRTITNLVDTILLNGVGLKNVEL